MAGMTEAPQEYRLYRDLAGWWPLISPPQEYAAEAGYLAGVFGSAAAAVREVLDLGSGGGHVAVHLKGRLALTLVDRSQEMLSVSRGLNPECAHVQGDMRTIRLGRVFDAVLVHDAVDYLTSEADLRQVVARAAAAVATRQAARRASANGPGIRIRPTTGSRPSTSSCCAPRTAPFRSCTRHIASGRSAAIPGSACWQAPASTRKHASDRMRTSDRMSRPGRTTAAGSHATCSSAPAAPDHAARRRPAGHAGVIQFRSPGAFASVPDEPPWCAAARARSPSPCTTGDRLNSGRPVARDRSHRCGGTGRPRNAASRSMAGAVSSTGCGSANRPVRDWPESWT